MVMDKILKEFDKYKDPSLPLPRHPPPNFNPATDRPDPKTDLSSYADDCNLTAYTTKRISLVEIRKSHAIFVHICRLLGLKINIDKTKFMTFGTNARNSSLIKERTRKWLKCPSTGMKYKDPNPIKDGIILEIDGEPIERVSQFKYLGVTIDYKGKFKTHTAECREATKKALGILKMVGANGKGARINSCIQFAEASVTSKLAYGAPATSDFIKPINYQFENPSQLDTRHTMALKKAISISTHVPNYIMLPEIGRLPLPSILKIRALNFAVKTIHSPKPHPLDLVLLKPRDTLHTEHIAAVNPPFSYCVDKPLKDIGVTRLDKTVRSHSLKQQFVGTISRERLWTGSKKDYPPDILHLLSLELMENQINNDTLVIYTDGSVNTKKGKAGAAAVILYQGDRIFASEGAKPTASSTETELLALLLALQKCLTLNLDTIKSVNIYTDSLSLTHLLEATSPVDHIELLGAIKQMSARLRNMKNPPIELLVQWIPSHVDIHGNETADRAARIASNLPTFLDFGRPKTHYRTAIKDLCQNEYREWALQRLNASENSLTTFYKLVNPDLKPCNYPNRIPRVLQQLLLLLRLNSLSICPMIHTNFCTNCPSTPFSTTHYLIECPASKDIVATLTKPNIPPRADRVRLMQEAATVVRFLSKRTSMLHTIASTSPPIVICQEDTCVFFNKPYNAYPQSWVFGGISHFAGAR